jgi:small-conductance mechanosensitive channel
MDIMLQVGYREDLNRVQAVLAEIARKNPFCLDEPEPLILFTEFKESGIEILVGMWFSKNDFLNLKNSIIKDISARFVSEGIEFPSPRRSVRMEKPDAPFSVRVSNEAIEPRGEGANTRGKKRP